MNRRDNIAINRSQRQAVMRNGQNNKRMRGRNRNHKGHHGGGGGGGGGGHHHNPLTRVYESNGPEVKIRGTAHHVAEKYLQLARDAQSSGDPVTAENHFQHAEHYLRLIAAAQEQFRQQNPYYQAPPAPGQGVGEEGFDGDDDGSQPMQAQGGPNQGGISQGGPQSGADQSGSGADQSGPSQSGPGPSGYNQPAQPQQNFNTTQSYGGPQNYRTNNQQPSYQPREQPQPYGGQPPSYQPRPQPQPYNSQPQQQPPQPQASASDGDRLPSFITGAQPQPAGPQNGQDGDQGGERYPRHRRRRHRSGGPRPEMAGGTTPQDFGGGSDGPEPGNT
jgi:hypothetical protein